jgi:cytochrome P450
VIDAGVDPIKHAVRWSFALLCHFPDVQNQLYEEIQAFKKEYGRLPTFNDKDRVPFVHSALTECIRFRAPTTFGIPHLVTEDSKLRYIYL